MSGNCCDIPSLLGTDEIEDNSLIQISTENTNFKVTFADLRKTLGVTGTIEQIGGISGAATLYKDGSTNFIRNMEAGPGINVATSPSGSIVISQSFAVNSVGLPLILNPTDSQPTVVSLVAGSGVTLTAAGNTITVAAVPTGIQSYGAVHVQNNATETDITAANTAAKIAATFSAGDQQQFVASSTGRLTYIGDDTREFVVTLSACLNTATGTKECAILIGKNGTAIAATSLMSDIANNTERNITTSWVVSLAQNDYVEGFVMNLDDDVNIIVRACVMQVHG